MHDGVVGAVPRDSTPQVILQMLEAGVNLYVLGEDLDARGLTRQPLDPSIKRINYDTLLELIIESKTLCSWL
jgi:sulfur relay protein TusB/DsrH